MNKNSFINKTVKLVEKIADNVAAGFFIIANFVLLYAVINRNIFKIPMPGYFELAKFIICWYVCIAAVAAAIKFNLIKVPILIVKYIPLEKRRIALVILYFLNTIFALIMFIMGTKLAIVGAGRSAVSIGISMFVPYVSIPLMGALLTLVFVSYIIKFWRGEDVEKYK